MAFKSLLLAAVHLWLAAPISALPSNITASSFHVIFEKHIPSGTTGLSAWTMNRDGLYGYSCDGPLAIQDAELSVELRDDTGNGFLVFGSSKFKIEDVDQAGGISCHERYNDFHVVVECDVPIRTGGVALPKPSQQHVDCFARLEEEEGFASAARPGEPESQEPGLMFEPVLESELDGSLVDFENGTEIDRRQICYTYSYTYVFNHGLPFKRVKHQQQTTNGRCTDGECWMEFEESRSISHSAGVSLNGGPWISGGYQVSFTTTQSQAIACTATFGQEVCIWHSQPYQRYQVLQQSRDCLGNFRSSSGRYWIESPRINHRAQHFYCVRNHCRAQGDGWWEDVGGGEW